MKLTPLRVLLLGVLLLATTGCRAMKIHDLEQRVGDLESRVANLEGRMAAAPAR
jgi:outer membrane murein-binding lipoprotein Lpp